MLVLFVLLLPSNLLYAGAISDTITMPQYEITKTPEGLDYIVWTGAQHEMRGTAGAPGAPDLPTVSRRLALPVNVTAASVKVTVTSVSWQDVAGVYDLAPVCLPAATAGEGVTLGIPAGKTIEKGKDAKAYSTDASLPSEPVAVRALSQSRKWKFIVIDFCPFRYNPVTRKLQVASACQYQVAFAVHAVTGAERALLKDKAFDPRIRQALTNGRDADVWYNANGSGAVAADAGAPAVEQGVPPAAPSTSPSDYVIITTQAIENASTKLTAFVTAKQVLGFTPLVVDETTWGGGTGNAAAEHIRAWLAANYVSRGIKYVLLIGDPDPSSGDVPMKMCWPRHAAPDGQTQSPTDYYYADLTGDWDLDGDGFYGEYPDDFDAGGVDLAPEVTVGRIPYYGNSAELDAILQKLIDYSTASGDLSWRKKGLIGAAISNYANEDRSGMPRTDASDWGDYCKSDVYDAAGAASCRQYEKEGLTPVTRSCERPLNQTNFLDEWTKGYGFVTWWAHGFKHFAARKIWTTDDGDGVPESSEMTTPTLISYSDCPSLAGAVPFVITCSCDNGYPENSLNLQYRLLYSGAVSSVGPSRVSWYAVGSWGPDYGPTCGDNSSYGYEIPRKMLLENMTFGEANHWCRQNFGTAWGGESYMNVYDFNVYGDPSLLVAPASVTLANDDFADRAVVNANGQMMRGTNAGATKEAGEPDHAGNSGGKSVWWTWTPAVSGSAQIDTIGSGFNTLLGVYTGGSVSTLTAVASDDDSGGNLTSKVTFSAVAGTAYQIAVDGYNGASGSIGLHVIGAWPAITTASLPADTLNIAYSGALAATGGSAPRTWDSSSGTLPPGLSIVSATGAITGTPTATGTFPFTARVTDNLGATATKPLAIVINPRPAIATASMPADTVSIAYSGGLTATGGTGVIVWSLQSGSLPAGVSLSAAGTITGTPTVAGTFSFTVRAVDTVTAAATKALYIVINARPAISTVSVPADTVSIAYSGWLAATGGTAPREWDVASGALPPGLSIVSGTGVISGTPTAAGTSTFTARVTDDVGATATRQLSIVINAAITVEAPGLPADTVSVAYPSRQLAAAGGTGALAWSLQTGSLPGGLSLSTGGAITGTPTAAGTFNFTVRAADSVAATATGALSIAINARPAISTAVLPPCTVNAAYNQTLGATGGTPPRAWSISSGSLPAGLSLSASTGAITGSPTASGTSIFTATLTDNVGATATRTLSISVNTAPVIATTSLPPDTVNVAYSQKLSSTGGSAPLAWSVSSGSLPPGLSLSASGGGISGTPAASGAASFTVTLTDNAGATATRALSIVINAAVAISTAGLPDGMVSGLYSTGLQASGGTGALAWSSSGQMPPGLWPPDHATGSIVGTAAAAGTYNFTATATDTKGSSDTRAFSITISPKLTISSARLHHAALKIPYDEPLYALGGAAPYSWSVASGTLPAGLSLESTGVISSTPTASGTSSFTARASDVHAWTATKVLSLTVTPAPAEWLAIDTFSVALPAKRGHDSFALQGSYNTWPDVYAPETVTLTLDNWHVSMRAASWKRVGTSKVYTWSQTGTVNGITYSITGTITYWVNGTSKCLFNFTGTNLTLAPSLANISKGFVNVTLQAGLDMKKTVMARGMTVTNNAAAMKSPAAPVLWVKKLAVVRNLTTYGHDSLALSALVYLDGSFNPALDALTMNIAGYPISQPAGSTGPAINGVVTYTKTTPYGKMTLSLNNKTHALTVSATGIDMSSVARPAEISLSITNHGNPAWVYGVYMAKNPAGTAYNY